MRVHHNAASRIRSWVPQERLDAGEEQLQRYSRWIQAWTPWVLVGWVRRHRLLSAAGGCVLAILWWGAGRAWADDGTGTADSTGGGDPLIAWMGIKDSHGGSVAKYTITINEGGADPIAKAFAWIDYVTYEQYRNAVATALWLIKFTLGFRWLSLFTGPFQRISDGITTAMNRFGLAAMALAVLAIIAVCAVLAGKVAKASSNIATGLLMIGVAATIFAHPLGQLVGPDGMLAKGRDTGLQIAATVSDGAMGDKGGSADVDGVVARLADRFLRSPTQMINFGRVADSISQKCEKAWTNGINNGHGDELKDDMKDCDDKKGDGMHRKAMRYPTAILSGLLMVSLLGLGLILFACYVAWHVVRSAVQAMMFAAVSTPAFAAGVIPGGPQTFAWKTVLDCAMAYLAMIIYTAGFGGYNVVLDEVFKSTENAFEALFLTALVVAFGFAFFGPLRRMLDHQRDKAAARLGGGQLSSSGQGWLSKAADLSQIRNALPHRAKGHSSGGAQGRDPVRIDAGALQPDAVVNIQRDGAVSVSATDGVDDPASSGSPQPAGAAGSGGPTAGGGGLKTDDRLAEAIRITQRRKMSEGRRPRVAGRPGPGPSGGGARHSMSEAA